MEISMHIVFDEFDDLIIPSNEEEQETQTTQETPTQKEEEDPLLPTKNLRIVGSHPPDQIIGKPTDGVRTRFSFKENESNLALISQIEPKSIGEAIIDKSWVEAMEEELLQFEKNQVWSLIPFPANHSIIGTRWVFRNKLNEEGKVVRNKSRLVAQGYNQQEGIDYDETFAPVARRASPFHNPSPNRPSFRQNNPSDEPLNIPALQTIFPPHFQQHQPSNLNQTPPHLKPKVKKKQPSSSLPTRRSQRILSGAGKSQSNDERIYITCETTDEEEDDPKKSSSSSTPKSSKTLSESSPNSSFSSEKTPSPKTSKPFSDKDKGKNVSEEAEAQPKKRFRQKSINELVKDRTPLFGKAAGRFFNLQALERHELDLKYYTDYQGWSHFLQIKETYYPRLVQAFFYQAYCDNDTNTIRSIVKGIEIVLDVNFIAKFFKLPTDGLKSYGSNWYSQANVTIDEVRESLFKPSTPKDQFTTPHLKLLPKIFNIISKGNIMPRQGKYDALGEIAETKVKKFDLKNLKHFKPDPTPNVPIRTYKRKRGETSNLDSFLNTAQSVQTDHVVSENEPPNPSDQIDPCVPSDPIFEEENLQTHPSSPLAEPRNEINLNVPPPNSHINTSLVSSPQTESPQLVPQLGATQATTQLDSNSSNFFNSSSQNMFDQPFFNDILNPPLVTTIPPMQAMPFMNDAGPSNPQPQPMPNLPRSKTERNTERIKRDIKKLFQGQQLIDNHLSYITMENSIMRD
ncbi:hypothetical protein TSUD_406900 [Trifolium subterraneum]|uniref:Reverse transcriptase Ty1/copia-type domain-containing protein n=1 Tax=Trifolium subterraneum TaxID=3900 RepID=A0A2Z6PGZ2_TRISU|nr:hypothetical protein TSUD_406900 [Trifolium subterraneum]